MKFIVDAMLGSLAKWLRILGYDTVYDPKVNDDDLFFKTHLENRILLTRDSELACRVKKGLSFLLKNENLRDQLKLAISHFELNTNEHIFTRCVLCNNRITEIKKDLIKNRLDHFIFETVDKFYFCEFCDKIYWAGSHVKLAKSFLAEINQREKNEK